MSKRPDITPKILNELYLVNRKTKDEICQELNITEGSLNYLLTKHKLHKTNGKSYKCGITKEMLYNAIYVENLTNAQIMKKFGICEQTIRKLIKEFDIPMRWDYSQYTEDVKRMYVDEKKSLQKIADEIKIPKSRVRKILISNNISLRGKGECQIAEHTVIFKNKWVQPSDNLRKRCRNYFSNHLVPKYKSEKCELCGSKEKLCVHHKIPFAIIVQQIILENDHLNIVDDEQQLYEIIINDDRFLDKNNLMTVCEKCHYECFHSDNILNEENQQRSP